MCKLFQYHWSWVFLTLIYLTVQDALKRQSPIREVNFFQKNIRGGDVLDYTNKHFEKIARERGFYSKELIEKIKENKGSLANLVEIPDDIRKIFRTAEDIAPEWHIKMLGAFQKHTENAVSKKLNYLIYLIRVNFNINHRFFF